jgi:hypothetical protein
MGSYGVLEELGGWEGREVSYFGCCPRVVVAVTFFARFLPGFPLINWKILFFLINRSSQILCFRLKKKTKLAKRPRPACSTRPTHNHQIPIHQLLPLIGKECQNLV